VADAQTHDSPLVTLVRADAPSSVLRGEVAIDAAAQSSTQLPPAMAAVEAKASSGPRKRRRAHMAPVARGGGGRAASRGGHHRLHALKELGRLRKKQQRRRKEARTVTPTRMRQTPRVHETPIFLRTCVASEENQKCACQEDRFLQHTKSTRLRGCTAAERGNDRGRRRRASRRRGAFKTRSCISRWLAPSPWTGGGRRWTRRGSKTTIVRRTSTARSLAFACIVGVEEGVGVGVGMIVRAHLASFSAG